MWLIDLFTLSKRITQMQAQVQALVEALNQQQAAVTSIGNVAQTVVNTMQVLKTSLNATIQQLTDGNELGTEDITALQGALTKASANTQAVLAAAQQLSNAATLYAASN
jgi:hypothetical protein